MSNTQSHAPERMHLKPLAGKNVSLALTGHPLEGCTGGLTNPVFRLAAMLG